MDFMSARYEMMSMPHPSSSRYPSDAASDGWFWKFSWSRNCWPVVMHVLVLALPQLNVRPGN